MIRFISHTGVVAILGLALLGACSEKENPEASAVVVPPAPAATSAGATIPAAAESPDSATKEFLEDVTHFNMYAIDAANAANARSKDAGVKAFAEKTVADYTSLAKEIDPVATSAGIMPPTARPPEVMAKLDALTTASADKFDAVFLAQEETELKAILERDKTYISSGANDTIKSFAQKRADRATAQLAAVEALKKKIK